MLEMSGNIHQIRNVVELLLTGGFSVVVFIDSHNSYCLILLRLCCLRIMNCNHESFLREEPRKRDEGRPMIKFDSHITISMGKSPLRH